MLNKKVWYWVCAVISGALWAEIALSFGAGAPASSGFISMSATLSCGVITGLLISALFRQAFLRASKGMWWLLPIATLVTSILIFSITTWIASYLWSFSSHQLFMSLGSIIAFYIVGGLMSICTPLFYGLALANQFVMRVLLKRAA